MRSSSVPRSASLLAAATTTAERQEETLSKRPTHKTVSDGVTTGGDKRQQMDHIHKPRGDRPQSAGIIKHAPRMHDIHRSPADEELKNENKEHTDGSTLGANIRSPLVVGSGLPRW